MTRFPVAGHLASWAKLSPRTIQSGAKRARLRDVEPAVHGLDQHAASAGQPRQGAGAIRGEVGEQQGLVVGLGYGSRSGNIPVIAAHRSGNTDIRRQPVVGDLRSKCSMR
ncbi:MAG: IS110 family transposase [Actinomycetota bacterium]|nr:IS110 family transposase [Actinomycetota bacterium]